MPRLGPSDEWVKGSAERFRKFQEELYRKRRTPAEQQEYDAAELERIREAHRTAPERAAEARRLLEEVSRQVARCQLLDREERAEVEAFAQEIKQKYDARRAAIMRGDE